MLFLTATMSILSFFAAKRKALKEPVWGRGMQRNRQRVIVQDFLCVLCGKRLWHFGRGDRGTGVSKRKTIALGFELCEECS